MADINFDDLWASVKGDHIPSQTQAKRVYNDITDGRYQVKIKHAQIDLTGEVHKVSFQYQIQSEGEFKNRIIFINYSMNEKALPILKRELKNLGVDVDAIKKLSDLDATLKTLIGRDVDVYTKGRKYVGRDGVTKTAYNAYVKGEVVTELSDGVALPPDLKEDNFSF